MEKINMLLLLQDSPKEKREMLKELEMSPQKLSPQLIELTKSKIVKHQDDNYELTAMGHLLVAEISSMIETMKFFHGDYWWNHNFNFIPSHLLKRLLKIRGWTKYDPAISEIYEYNKAFYEKTLLSDSVSLLSVVQPPFFFKWASEILDRGGNLSVIFELNLFNKIKEDNPEALQKLINSKHFRLYTYSELRGLFYFVQCDTCILLRPLTNDDSYDHTHLINSSMEAVQWGREIFEYYVRDSALITEI
ncbi:helix-turn-helix transcriptional regulator [Methanolobus chelungpuianus]|nr:transcriptional regulator FilR1 domain-containing protein [Methanolobus chelungpuianus]